uniref:Uncharacterized protein n=1 Tax=Oryza punctata TaxID=4537 RepID=A0A0E0M4I1_ORYPU
MAAVKAKGLRRSGEFHMGYPRKQNAGVINMMDSDMRIINDFDYAYTQSTISQYFFPNFNAATGVVKAKGLRRSGEFHMGYPRKQNAGVINIYGAV